jgi:hypothetical protein
VNKARRILRQIEGMDIQVPPIHPFNIKTGIAEETPNRISFSKCPVCRRAGEELG